VVSFLPIPNKIQLSKTEKERSESEARRKENKALNYKFENLKRTVENLMNSTHTKSKSHPSQTLVPLLNLQNVLD